MRVSTTLPVTPSAREMRSAVRKIDEGEQHDGGRDRHEARERPPVAAGAAGEQHRRGDRAGPRHERDRQGKGGDVADMVDHHRVARDLALALAAQREQHVEGDIEQQQPAGDAEGGEGDAERLQRRPAAEGEGGENAEGDEAGAQRDLALLRRLMPSVRPTKTGASPGGSSVTNSVTSAVLR